MYIQNGIAYAGEPMQDAYIEDAQVVNDLCKLIKFSTGEMRLFDAVPLIEKPAFGPLSSPETFQAFSIDHGVLCWLDGDIDIAPEYLYEHSYRYEKSA